MKRYWVHADGGEQITGPFDTESAAAKCVRALKRETGDDYYLR